MAEAWTGHLRGDIIEPYSAGVDPRRVDPRAVKAMEEVGIDISGQKSKSLDALEDVEFDYVITVCDNAQQSCPVFPAETEVVHVGFEDPPKLAAEATNEDQAMGHYRRIRDEIKAFVEKLPEGLA
jgi:arsenate reductase